MHPPNVPLFFIGFAIAKAARTQQLLTSGTWAKSLIKSPPSACVYVSGPGVGQSVGGWIHSSISIIYDGSITGTRCQEVQKWAGLSHIRVQLRTLIAKT